MIKDRLILTPTDTTIGFISQNRKKIDIAKKRLPNKHYIKTINSLKSLMVRVPQKYKRVVRGSKKTTFIMPNGNSFRIVRDTKHNLLLDRLKWAYSSSANLSGEEYNREYAKAVADIIVYEPHIKSGKSSKIYKLGVNSIKRVR